MLLMWANHTIKSVDYVEKINRTLVISPWSRREDFTLGLPHNKKQNQRGHKGLQKNAGFETTVRGASLRD